MLEQLIKLKVLGMALVLAAACAADGEPVEEPTPEPDPPAGEGVLLTDWVDAMVENAAEPDTVNDKPAIVINVEDTAPFAKYFR
jgi:hypothetical protein